MIANDGNIMEHTVPFDGTVDLNGDGNLIEHKGQLPEQGIAERYDIIIDFSKNGIKPKDKIYVVNMLEHRTGRKPNQVIPLEDILSKAYNPKPRDDDHDGIRDRWIKGDPGVGMVMQFRVRPYKGVDLSMNPANYLPGGKTMIPLKIDRTDPVDQARLANAVHHTFEFARSNGTDNSPWTIKTDGGRGFNMDPRRISVAPRLSTAPTAGGTPNAEAPLQIWHIKGNGGWSHPVHIHFEEGIILTRGKVAPPEWERWARKDLYRIGPLPDSTDDVEVALQFREFAGTFMEHCHNTQHEDHSMLLRWDIEHPGQVTTMPAPMPTWDGVEYLDSEALPSFRTGDGLGPDNNL